MGYEARIQPCETHISKEKRMTPQSEFDEIYWRAQHPDKRALRQMTSPEEKDRRENVAAELAVRGIPIDRVIDVFGCSPHTTMTIRDSYGLKWTPSLFQDPEAIFFNDAYRLGQGPMPEGAIKVSLDPADYPPYPDPEPPKPVVENLARPGSQVSANRWGLRYGDTSPVGTKWQDASGLYIKNGTPWMGTFMNAYWEKVG